MIVAERKPIEEIQEMIAPFKRVLVAGCGGCVTVCLTGGEKEVEILASQLRMLAKRADQDVSIGELTITRQCDEEFVRELVEAAKDYDAILSMACGAGVQLVSDFTDIPALPAMNTTFLGANYEPGIWKETCHGCGDCMLAETAGICPVARCSKSLVNGTCGGTNDGKCEVNPEIDCAWYLIYNRLKERGKLHLLARLRQPRDWSKERGSGPRRLTREEMLMVTEGESDE